MKDRQFVEITSIVWVITRHMGMDRYLSPGSSDFPTFTPAEAGTRFSNPGGIQG